MAPSSCEHAWDCVLLGIVCSERGAQPTCPQRAWQATACKAWQVLHTACLPCCSLPWLWGEFGQLTASHPFLAFLKGCCSVPAAMQSFGK